MLEYQDDQSTKTQSDDNEHIITKYKTDQNNKNSDISKFSQESLNYYKKLVFNFKEENLILIKNLDYYKSILKEQQNFELELQQKSNNIIQLQKSLSDMQLYIFQEREQILRLYSENERLKIKELEDRDKIQRLLKLNKITANKSNILLNENGFLFKMDKNNNNDDIRGSSTSIKMVNCSINKECNEKINSENNSLYLRIKALQIELHEHSKLSNEQIELMLNEKKIIESKYELSRRKDQERINLCTGRLQQIEDLLYENTQDIIKWQQKLRFDEESWMISKEDLTIELNKCRKELDEIKTSNIESSFKPNKQLHYKKNINPTMHKNSKSEKLEKKVDALNKKYTDFQHRKNLEVDGYKTDIKLIRDKLKHIESEIFKIQEDSVFQEVFNDQDSLPNKSVKQISIQSKQIQNDINEIKSNLMNLENHFKHS